MFCHYSDLIASTNSEVALAIKFTIFLAKNLMQFILLLAQIILCQPPVCTKDQTPQDNNCLPVVGSSVQDTTGSGPSGGNRNSL